MVQDHFRKNAFLPHFRPTFCPKMAHFQGISGFSKGQNTPFLAIFGLFLGHIVELEGKKGLLFTSQLRPMWSVGTLCLRLAVMTRFWGRFGPKKAVLGHTMRSFGRAPPDLAPPPRGATAEFLAINLDLARPPPRL